MSVWIAHRHPVVTRDSLIRVVTWDRGYYNGGVIALGDIHQDDIQDNTITGSKVHHLLYPEATVENRLDIH